MRLNKIMLIGRIGKKPELREINSGQEVTKFSIAVDDGYYDKKSSSWVDRTVWADVVAWGKLAEKVSEFDKGLLVLVEGKYTNRKVEKDGATRYYHEFVANVVTPMEKREKVDSSSSYIPPATKQPMQKADIQNAPDDLPF